LGKRRRQIATRGQSVGADEARCDLPPLFVVERGTWRQIAAATCGGLLYQMLICRGEGEPYPPLRGYFPDAKLVL